MSVLVVEGVPMLGEYRIEGLARCVLVATDFRPMSQTALAGAVSLADACGASLHVLHVLEEIVGAEPLETEMRTRGDLERAIERRVWDDLRALVGEDGEARLRVRVAVEWGAPASEILRYAQAHDVDLIAIGRHGKSDLTDVLLGSVADAVIRHACCSVLSVGSSATRHRQDASTNR